MVGMSWDSYDATEIDRVTFDLGFVIEDAAPDSLEIVELPAMTSVEAHSNGALLRIAQTWDHLYLNWLPSSQFEPADLPAIKRFRRRPDETGWEHWDVDCCIAIQRLTP